MSVMLSPLQIVSAVQITVGFGTLFTVTDTGADAGLEQVPTVQVAVYEVVVAGVTVIEAPVIPLDHVTVPAQLAAVKIAELPTQMLGVFTLTTGAEPTLLTVTVTGAEAGLEQVPTVQVAVYEVVVAGVTVIEVPVMPLDHVTVPAQLVAVKIAELPTQMLGVFTLTTGAEPTLLTFTVTGAEAGLEQVPTVQVAVYEVVVAGVTVIEAPVIPLDHVTVPAQFVAVRVADSPTQITLRLVATNGAGVAPTFTTTTLDGSLSQAVV